MGFDLTLSKDLPEGFLRAAHGVNLWQVPSALTHACVIDAALPPLEIYERYAAWARGCGLLPGESVEFHLAEVKRAVDLGYEWSYL